MMVERLSEAFETVTQRSRVIQVVLESHLSITAFEGIVTA